MNGSHIAGAGFGAIVGAVLVSLGGRIGLDLTNFDSATLGMAAIAAGVGVFHAVSEYGVKGIAKTIWAGRAKPAPAPVVAIAPVVDPQSPAA